MNALDRTKAARPRRHGSRAVVAVLGFVVTLAIVFGAADMLVGRLVAERYPAPEQAAVWVMMGRFVSALLALAAAAQVWWWLRQR